MLAAVIVSTACSASVSASPSPVASVARSATPSPDPLTFRVGPEQARMVATLVAFLDAYNVGDASRALALMTDDVSISDCDYRGPKLLNALGHDAARQELTDRAADQN